MGAGVRPAAPRRDRRAGAGWHPAALSIAARAGGEGRGVRDGIGRHAAAVPRGQAQRDGCVARPLGSARLRDGAPADSDGRRCRGAADRLRERRQSADRAWRGAAARAGAAGRGRGGSATDHPAAADREPAPRRGRRRAWSCTRHVGRQRPAWLLHDARGASCRDTRSRRAHPVVYLGACHGDGAHCGHHACVPQQPCGRGASPEERRRLGRRRAAPPAQDTRRRSGRAVVHAADRCGPLRAQPAQPARHRPGIPVPRGC